MLLTRIVLNVFDLIKDFLLTKLNDLSDDIVNGCLKRNRSNRNDILLDVNFTLTTKSESTKAFGIDSFKLTIIHDFCSCRRIRNQKDLCIRILQEGNRCFQDFLKVKGNIRSKCITNTRQLRIDQCMRILCREIFRLNVIASISRLHIDIGDIEISEEAFQCILRKLALNVTRSCCLV